MIIYRYTICGENIIRKTTECKWNVHESLRWLGFVKAPFTSLPFKARFFPFEGCEEVDYSAILFRDFHKTETFETDSPHYIVQKENSKNRPSERLSGPIIYGFNSIRRDENSTSKSGLRLKIFLNKENGFKNFRYLCITVLHATFSSQVERAISLFVELMAMNVFVHEYYSLFLVGHMKHSTRYSNFWHFQPADQFFLS